MMEEPQKSRRFILIRMEDESGISGTGTVAEGVVFRSGRVVMEWLISPYSIGFFQNVADLIRVHGHGGKTVLNFMTD